MKIYLLNPPYFPHFGRGARWQDTGRGGTLYYPIWLSYATALLELKHETRLIDAPAREWNSSDVIKDIGQFSPGLLVMDSSFPSLNNDLKIAELIKGRFDSLPITLVGPPTSQFPDRILASAGIDIVARMEYDFTLEEIAARLEKNSSLKDVKGISYKENGLAIHNADRPVSTGQQLDAIPFVSKVYGRHLNIKDYFLGQSLYPEVQIFTGRGCPNQCTFCSWPETLSGRKYRVRSIGSVLDELQWIQDNLNVKEVFFEDDTFTIDKKRVLEFCKQYRERKLKVTWACNARVDTLDLETMRAMKKAHCRLLIAGYESGSAEILRNVKKGTTVDQMKAFARNARKAGLLVHGDFVFGLPGETKETIQTTKSLIWELRPEILQVSVASPFPGTAFYDYCKSNGYLLTDDPNRYLDENGHQIAIISYPGLTTGDMTSVVDHILKEYYVSPRYVPLAIRQVLRRNGPNEFRRLWYSVKMYLKYVGEKNSGANGQ